MPCETSLCRSSRETCRTIGENKTKYACIVEADESSRKRLEGAPHRYHEDHIAGKDMNSSSRYKLVHTFIPMPQAMKIPDAKAAVEKNNGKKLEKIPAWQLTKVRNKKEVIDEARNEGKTVHFPKEFGVGTNISEMQRSSSTPRWHCERWFCIVCCSYRARIISITNDGSKSNGCHSKTTRIQAAGAVSAYTQVKMEDAPSLLKIPKSECPDIWIRLPRHKWPKSWSSMEDPVVPLERNLYGHPLAGLLWERQFEKILLKYGWEEVPNWECLFVNRDKGLFLSVYVDDIKIGWKKRNIDPTWKILLKDVDLGEPTWFLDHIYLGCIQRECQISKDIVDNYRNMFEPKISARATEKLPYSEKLCANISSWSYDMEGLAKKCVERYCELAKKQKQHNSYIKSQHHALTTTNSKKKKWDLLGNCRKFVLTDWSSMSILGSYFYGP